ncbi:GLPGLI family protein [Cloacibacterium normanense]|uniref:GLPGLI family protein n=1 Tax=Cloacibacterium normanense TaxID=237258 RepID=A0A2S7I6S4_9FLAO|nr:GLPGLI family protein [Cloacibacterium normanense]PPZ92266.1 GLPGLI family protein [Cloacibacterium normanense]
MKINLLVILTFFGLCINAQTNRFFYELQSRKDSTQEYKKNYMVLDINPKSIKFYDKDLLDYDSINKSKEGVAEYRTNTKTDQLVIRKPNSFKNDWYRDFKEYFVIHTNDEMKWKLYTDFKNYNGYKLQKATTNFGGRKWTAWFSEEIEVSEGPYKFRGLPGLIFLLNDSENNFIYKLVKNTKLKDTYETKQFLENHYDQKPLVVSNEVFNKYLIDFYENPTRLMGENIKNGGNASINGKAIKSIEDLNMMKKSLQNIVKNRYIFIEKDKEPIFGK